MMLMRIVPTDFFGMVNDTDAASRAAEIDRPRRNLIGVIFTFFATVVVGAGVVGGTVVVVVVVVEDDVVLEDDVVVVVGRAFRPPMAVAVRCTDMSPTPS